MSKHQSRNQSAVRTALLPLLVVWAEATTIFSLLHIFFMGLFVMSYNLLLRCFPTTRMFFTVCGAFLCFSVSVLQFVALIQIDEDMLTFCEEYDMEDAYCDLTLYRAMNGSGVMLWSIAGLVACTIPASSSQDDDDDLVLPTTTATTTSPACCLGCCRRSIHPNEKQTPPQNAENPTDVAIDKRGGNRVEWADPIGIVVVVPVDEQNGVIP